MTLPSYHVDSTPFTEGLEIFQLQYDRLGELAVELMNAKFGRDSSRRNIVKLDLKYVAYGKPMDNTNLFTRWALADAVSEITERDTRTISLAESEIAFRDGTLPEKSSPYWEDLGVVIPSKMPKNDQLGHLLLNQAKERGLKVKLPAIATNLTVISDLEVRSYGVRLDLGKNGEIYHAPILKDGAGFFDDDDPELVKTGLPGKFVEGDYEVGGEKRVLWLHSPAASSGYLMKICRTGTVGLLGDIDLQDIQEKGRVNLVRAVI